MTTVEAFQVVAALGAALGVLGFLVPGLRGRSAAARQAGALAMTVAAWVLLVGSLVARDDLSRLGDRIDTPVRAVGVAIAALLLVGLTVVAVRMTLRRPVVWLVLVAVALPLRVPVSLGGDRSGNLLVPLYWVIVVGLVAWAWGRWRGTLAGTHPATMLDIPVAAFTAFSLMSIWWSGDIQEGVIKAVFFYIPFVLLYRLVLVWWPRATAPLRAVTVTTILLASAIALVAVGQYATTTIWWNDTLQQGNVYNRFFRANGIFYDPNILGRYLMVAIVAAVACAWVSRRPRDLALLGGAVVALAAGLTVTFSRSSALGLMVAVTLLAVWLFGVRRTVLVGAAALVLVGVPVIAINENVRDKATSVERLAGSSEGRVRLVQGGVDLWRTAPVTGVGLGAFSEEYRQALPRRQQLRTRVVISHTAPVTVLAELGVVGFALFAILCLTTVVALWRAARADGAGGLAQWAMLAILAGIFVHSLLYSALFEDPMVWALAAAGLAVGMAPALAPRDDTAVLPAVAAPAAG